MLGVSEIPKSGGGILRLSFPAGVFSGGVSSLSEIGGIGGASLSEFVALSSLSDGKREAESELGSRGRPSGTPPGQSSGRWGPRC